MSDQNCINFTGMVLKDPEKVGDKGAKFSVINGRGSKDKPIKNFFNCITWSKQAEFVLKYLKARRRVAITGEMNSREYEGKTYWDVTVRDIAFLPGGGEKKDDAPKEESKSESKGDQRPAENYFDDDDIPL